MPKIEFILVSNRHCPSEYKVRLDRIEQPLDCVTCGYEVDTLVLIPFWVLRILAGGVSPSNF